MRRRDVIRGASGLALAAGLSGLLSQAHAVPAPVLPDVAPAITGEPFDRAILEAEARALASRPYVAPAAPLAESLETLGYDGYHRIEFRKARALWNGTGRHFTAEFFHRGFLYRTPVALYEVADGKAYAIRYSSEFYDFGLMALGQPFREEMAFAGFRLHAPLNRPDVLDELIAFLGASYFRALGQGHRYGKSARGLAIDTALPKGEEFPVFRAFWLERPEPQRQVTRVHALLDSESVSGAYTFEIAPGPSTVTAIDAVIFPRRSVDRLGIAPLTSMYFFGENDRQGIDDFRPEVHDSDGLQIWTGGDEWIWRPLVNPTELRQSAFVDRAPRGFGLMKRDRDFANYQDLEAAYDLRPSVWVEPVGDWGEGAVELIEIPTPTEVHDNIVVFWRPAQALEPGIERRFACKLHWCTTPPAQSKNAQVTATRVGSGGFSGGVPNPLYRKFVVEFSGGQLANLRPDDPVEAVVSVAGGQVSTPVVEKVREGAVWRTFFDLVGEAGQTAELRCFLRIAGAALTETWSYQWTA